MSEESFESQFRKEYDDLVTALAAADNVEARAAMETIDFARVLGGSRLEIVFGLLRGALLP